MSKQRAQTALNARKFINALDERFQRRRYQTEAVVTGVVRDGAERATRVLATIDGVGSQRVAIDHGAPYAVGDVLLVENAGTETLPRWSAVRKLQSVEAIPNIDPNPTLPTPTGLSLETGHWAPEPGGGMKAWIYAEWLSIGDEFGYVGYDVAYKTNDQVDPAIRQIVDMRPTTLTAMSLVTGSTLIPRAAATSSYDFPKFGRIQIEAEKIDYTAVTDGDPRSGTGGVGALKSFTVSGAGWTVNQWVNYCLIDSAGARFLITANTATVLTLYAGTPASGAYTIRPCFSICTRGVGGTTVTAHAAGKTIKALSVGVMLDGLQPDIDYNVRVRAHRMDGAVSAWTAWASIQTDIDTEAPPAPTGLTATPAPGQALLAWTGPTQDVVKDLAGFEIYAGLKSDGSDASLVRVIGPALNAEVTAPAGLTYYYNLKAFDTAGNTSGFGTTWVSCRAQIAGEVQLLVNSDFERDSDGSGVPDEWYAWSYSTTTGYGAYGINGGKGLRWVLPASTAEVIGEAYQVYYSGAITPRLAPAVNRWYNLSCYVYVSVAQSYWHLATGYTSGKVKMYCRLVKSNGAGPDTITQDYPMEIVETRPDGWVRLTTRHLLTSSDVSGYSYVGLAVGVYAQNLASSATVQVDRVQLEIDGPTAWQPNLVNVGGASSLPYGLQIDSAGIKEASGTFWLGDNGKMYSHFLPGGSSLDLGSTTLPWRNVIAAGDGRIGGGLYVGSTGTDPATGDVIATVDGRFGGGLSVGSTDTNPTPGTVVATAGGSFAGGLHVGSTASPVGSSYISIVGSGGDVQRITAGGTADALLINYGDGGDVNFYGGATSRKAVIFIDGDFATVGGIYAGGIGSTTSGDILYTSNLRPYRNSTAYTGYVVVPLTTALTSTSWDGDNKAVDTHTIDTSTVFSCPAGVKGVFIRLLAKWASLSDSQSVNARAKEGSGAAVACQCSQAVAVNKYVEQCGFCPCDANGDIEIVVVGYAATVILQITGYIL